VEVGPESTGEVTAAMGPDGGLAAGRFARGVRCFVVRAEGGIAAYAWVSRREEWIGEVAAPIRVPAGDAYVWNCVTLEPHRRRGLFGLLLAGVSAALHEAGAGRLWIATVDGEPAGGRGARSAGFAPVASLTVLRAGGLRAMRVSGGAGASTALGERLRIGRWRTIPH
jgi:hypothetical protein